MFDAYPARVRAARSAGLLTGLPDAYGRGRIIGDYRRVPLYGVDYLIEAKKADLDRLDGPMTDELIRLREEVSEQIRALEQMKSMAARYGVDISRPAANAQKPCSGCTWATWPASRKTSAATSLGRTSTFLDIYIQRDLDRGILDEQGARS